MGCLRARKQTHAIINTRKAIRSCKSFLEGVCMGGKDDLGQGHLGWGNVLQLVIDVLPDPIFVKDGQHRWVACNAAFCRLIGQPHEKLIGRSDPDFWPRAQAEEFWRIDDVVMASGVAHAQEEAATGSDGVLRTIWTRKFPLHDSKGHVIGVCGIITDITELQQHEERVAQLEAEVQAKLTLLDTQKALSAALARQQQLEHTHNQLEHDLAVRQHNTTSLRNSETWFRNLAKSSLDLIAIVDLPQLSVAYVNHHTWLGYAARDLVQLDVLEHAVHPDDWPALAAYWGQVSQAGASVEQRIEYRLRQPRGGWEWLQSRATPFMAEAAFAPNQVLITLSVITEHKRLEAALRASEERYRLIAETATDAIVSINEANTIVFVNGAAAEIFGYEASEMFGQSLSMLMPPAMRQSHSHGMRRYLATNVRHMRWEASEIVGLHKSGREIPLQVSFGEYRTDAGRVFTGIMRDISGQKRLAAQLLHAQKLEGVGRLAGGIAHDFNNLLTAIMGSADMALDELAEDGALRQDIATIQYAAQRAARLTRQLLAFARRQVIEPRVLDLNELLATVMPLLRRLVGEATELVVLPTPDLQLIKADPGQIEQVLMNLVANAHDAMPNGGRIELATANVEPQQPSGEIYATPTPDRYVQLTVRDTGIGMDAPVLQHIFEPFFTTKELGKGTGLGLAMCYGIVAQHGGQIEVSSVVGQGTTVTILLPQCNQPIAAPLPPVAEALPTGTETILLVEDELTVRQLVAQVLRKQHYTVLEAANGVDALQLLAEFHPRTVALLITDVMMPQMGGEALVAHLRKRKLPIRVLFMSGYVDQPLALEQHDGKAAYLAKPFSPTTLVRKVRELLDY